MQGSVINHIMANSKSIEPERGMGATVLMYTDRKAATIVLVNIAKTSVFISMDTATRIDSNGMSESQTYEYASNMDSKDLSEYTLRKNGRWVKKGEGMKNGQKIAIGFRETYHDYSF